MKKFIIFALALGLAIVLAACGGNDSKEENTNKEDKTSEQSQQPAEELKFTDEERLENDATVATVNGEELNGADYNPVYSFVKSTLYQYGQDVSDLESIKKQSVETLIDQTLIMQDAKNNGIEVTEEEAQAELDKIKESGSEEQLTAMLEQYNMSEDELKNQLITDLTTVEYVEDQFPAEVTDKEVKEYYDQLKEQNAEIGELKEVEGQIKETLVSKKQNEQLRTKVDELKENGEVETML